MLVNKFLTNKTSLLPYTNKYKYIFIKFYYQMYFYVKYQLYFNLTSFKNSSFDNLYK